MKEYKVTIYLNKSKVARCQVKADTPARAKVLARRLMVGWDNQDKYILKARAK